MRINLNTFLISNHFLWPLPGSPRVDFFHMEICDLLSEGSHSQSFSSLVPRRVSLIRETFVGGNWVGGWSITQLVQKRVFEWNSWSSKRDSIRSPPLLLVLCQIRAVECSRLCRRRAAGEESKNRKDQISPPREQKCNKACLLRFNSRPPVHRSHSSFHSFSSLLVKSLILVQPPPPPTSSPSSASVGLKYYCRPVGAPQADNGRLGLARCLCSLVRESRC